MRRNGRPSTSLLTDEVLGYLAQISLAARTRQRLTHLPRDPELAEPLPDLEDHSPEMGAGCTGGAAYYAQTEQPVVRLLACDDAPQFSWLTEGAGAVLGDEGRHYQKLNPFLLQHRQVLADFWQDFWAYGDDLVGVSAGTEGAAQRRLAAAFVTLFARKRATGGSTSAAPPPAARNRTCCWCWRTPRTPSSRCIYNPAELGA